MAFNHNIIQFCDFFQNSRVRKFANLGHQNDILSTRIKKEECTGSLLVSSKCTMQNLCYAFNFGRLCPNVTGPMKY